MSARQHMSGVLLGEQATPAAPTTGTIVYTKSGGGVFYRSASGVETQLGSGSGGSSGNPIVQIEQDVGPPARTGHFTITDATFTPGQQLYIQMSADPLTGKGTRSDENDMDAIEVRGSITGTGTATAYWSSRTYVTGNFKFNYRSS